MTDSVLAPAIVAHQRTYTIEVTSLVTVDAPSQEMALARAREQFPNGRYSVMKVGPERGPYKGSATNCEHRFVKVSWPCKPSVTRSCWVCGAEATE